MRGNPQNMAAYELYLRGRHLADRFNLKDVEDGLLYLKEATALDPDFARAGLPRLAYRGTNLVET